MARGSVYNQSIITNGNRRFPGEKRSQRARGLGGAHSTPTRPGLNRMGFTSERQQRNNPLRSEELRRGLDRKDKYRAKATEKNQGNRGREKEREANLLVAEEMPR